jgi:hypothetical protein
MVFLQSVGVEPRYQFLVRWQVRDFIVARYGWDANRF